MNNVENLSDKEINYLISKIIPKIKIIDNTRYFLGLFIVIMILILFIIILVSYNFNKMRKNKNKLCIIKNRFRSLEEDFTNLNRLVTRTDINQSKFNNSQVIQKENIELFSNSDEIDILINSIEGN